MMINKKYKAYLDNSIISELRNDGDIDKYERNKQLILVVKEYLERYEISEKDIIFTDRLLPEMLGYGNFRKKMKVSCKEYTKNERNVIFSKISTGEEVLESEINDFICALEDFFKEVNPESFTNILDLKNLEKYPFFEEFSFFEDKIRDYCKTILDDPSRINLFKETLIMDSVIREAIDLFNLKEISPKYHKNTKAVVNIICSQLAKKYNKPHDLKNHLILLASFIYKHEQNFHSHSVEKNDKWLLDRVQDLADADMQKLAFYGIVIGNEIFPIIVFTKELFNAVKKRLDVYAVCCSEIIKNNGLIWGNEFKKILIAGKTIVLSHGKPIYTEILTCDIIKNNTILNALKKDLNERKPPIANGRTAPF